MKNMFLFACLLFVLLFTASYLARSHHSPVKESALPTFRIAVVTPVIHPSLEQIQKGFCEALQANPNISYQFTTYNGQGSKALLRAEIEEVVRGQYDLILAIGTQAAKMGKEVLTKKRQKIPLVFTAVSDPVGHHLVSTELIPGDFVTGVREATDYPKQLQLLSSLLENLSHVVLVYDPTQAGLDKDKACVEEELARLGIKLTPVEVFKTNEIKQKLLPYMADADVVMILKDNTVVTGLETLAKLCQSHQAILFASDLDSPDKGAAIGFGVKEYDFGVEAAKKAQLILEQGASPQFIPVTPVDQFKLIFNEKALLEQGSEPSLHLLERMQKESPR